MTSKDAYIRQLENMVKSQEILIKQLQAQIENLTEAVLAMRHGKFGPSSEKTPKSDENQLSIFNEVELHADEKAEDPIVRDVNGYKRVNRKTKGMEIIGDLPVREIECTSGEADLVCPQCSGMLKPLGKETVREELEYIPARLQIVRYTRWSYECPACKHTDHPHIQKALTPTSLMNHSLASPSSVAHVMYEKYVKSVPLYRQEKDWMDMGLSLSRATMANWIIRCSEDYLMPVVQHLKKHLMQRDILHADETPVQVLKEEGKAPQSKSYMWLYCSGNDGLEQIILYDYQSSRSGKNAADYIEGFHGYVHSDGYSGYNRLTGITRCGCWAHVRRKFVEAVPRTKASGNVLSDAETGRAYCDRLFMLERELQGLSADERKQERLSRGKAILGEFWSWLETVKALPGSKLGKAVTYALNQKPYLENYLEDGRCSISNNTAENAIRPFVVGRKNWLFADTPGGASASAAVYSIVETAKANGLNVYTYLEYLLLYMPDWDHTDEYLENLMPWSEAVQAECTR